LVISTAANSVPSVREGEEPIVDAARYAVVPTLMDSLLHDVRNPLNALSIHLEVLSEKLKAETGQVPASQEKNLRAMREQIQRMDGILRRFAEFIVWRGGKPGEADLSDTVARALEVLAHESRRRRLQPRTGLTPAVRVRLADAGDLGFLVVQSLMGAYERAEVGSELSVTVRTEGPWAVLEVEVARSAEESTEAASALALRCAQLGVEFQRQAGSCRLAFALA
jgi:phosphoglycerate-specific signal transduction histidine kinase